MRISSRPSPTLLRIRTGTIYYILLHGRKKCKMKKHTQTDRKPRPNNRPKYNWITWNRRLKKPALVYISSRSNSVRGVYLYHFVFSATVHTVFHTEFQTKPLDHALRSEWKNKSVFL